MTTDYGLKQQAWMISHSYVPFLLIFISAVGCIILSLSYFRITRKMKKRGQDKHPLPKSFIFLGIWTAMAVVSLLINYFHGAPSQVQLENELKMSTDNGLKYQAWQISHPYAVPLLIFLSVVAVLIISASRIYRKMKEGKSPLLNLESYFCIATVMAIVALLICIIRGK